MRRCRCCCQVRVQQQLFLAVSKRARESERVRDKQRTAEAIFGSIMFHLVAADSGRITHSHTHTQRPLNTQTAVLLVMSMYFIFVTGRGALFACCSLSQSVPHSLALTRSASQPASRCQNTLVLRHEIKEEKKNKTNNNNNNGVNDDYES